MVTDLKIEGEPSSSPSGTKKKKVRVPSLCFNKDTNSNYDDELVCLSLSVKLASSRVARFAGCLDERSLCSLRARRRRETLAE